MRLYIHDKSKYCFSWKKCGFGKKYRYFFKKVSTVSKNFMRKRNENFVGVGMQKCCRQTETFLNVCHEKKTRRYFLPNPHFCGENSISNHCRIFNIEIGWCGGARPFFLTADVSSASSPGAVGLVRHTAAKRRHGRIKRRVDAERL